MLENDTSVEDLLPAVRDRGEFLGLLVRNLNACFREHGGSFVRIGIAGTGKKPNHIVVFDDDEGIERTFGRFDTFGGNKEFGEEGTDAESWSTVRSSYDDVRVLLATVRGLPAPKPLIAS